LHSVILTKEQVKNDPNSVQGIFSLELFHKLVRRFGDDRFAVYNCGPLQEDRTKMLVDYADEVARIQALIDKKTEAGKASEAGATSGVGTSLKRSVDEDPPLSSRVRQKGALSSFHIPDEPLRHRCGRSATAGFPGPNTNAGCSATSGKRSRGTRKRTAAGSSSIRAFRRPIRGRIFAKRD
jgi:hypothetical protein